MFNKMYDIITFGSAAQDIHVKSKAFKILNDEKDFDFHLVNDGAF